MSSPSHSASTSADIAHLLVVVEDVDEKTSATLSTTTVEQELTNDVGIAPAPPSVELARTMLNATTFTALEQNPNHGDNVILLASVARAGAGAGVEIIDDEDGPPPLLAMLETFGVEDQKKPAAMKIPASSNNRTLKGAATIKAADSRLSISQFEPTQDAAMTDKSEHLSVAVARAGVELIQDWDEPPPQSYNMPLESFDGDSTDLAAMKTAASRNIGKQAKAGPEIIEDSMGPALPPFMMNDRCRPPVPFYPANVVDDDEAMKKLSKGRKKQTISANINSTIVPPRDEIEDEVELRTSSALSRREESPTNSRGNADNSHSSPGDTNVHADEEVGNAVNLTTSNDLLDAMVSEGLPEVHAYMVEERNDEFVVATPALPWWKLKQAKLFFAFVSIFLIAAVIAICMVVLSSEPAVTVTITSSNAPSISFSPSSSPSMCVDKISSNAQKIDLPLNDPRSPKVAVDGMNMVVVSDGDRARSSPVFVMFYSLVKDDWQRVNAFPIDELDLDDYYEVALSGKTAFVGFPYYGMVLVYELNRFGDWEKVEDPFIPDPVTSNYYGGFGEGVAIDGGLAVVEDWDQVHIYRRESNKWVEVDRVDRGYKVSMSGDTIAICAYNMEDYSFIYLYKYLPDQDGVFLTQDPISTKFVYSIDVSHNYLVWLDGDWYGSEEAISIYRREGANQTFAFHQNFSIFDNGDFYLTLDKDILVIGGTNKTHIFSDQHGSWSETMTLDGNYEYYALSGWNYYALSGRNLLVATRKEVHSFNIQDCVQEMPTQTPSLSLMPTDLPTSLPSMGPSSSLAPTLSFSPSTSPSPSVALSQYSSFFPTEVCYWITISIVYDHWPKETHWELIWTGDGDWELVESYAASHGDISYSRSICLQEGEYTSSMYDTENDGMCCGEGKGHYNLTSNGALINKGGTFEWREETTFSIPFIPGSDVIIVNC